MIDKEKLSIPLRSPKLFTLSTLYDANLELLGKKIEKQGSKEYKQKIDTAVEYWNAIANVIPDWKEAKSGDVKPAALRQEKINTHAVVLRALGGLGKVLIEAYPNGWKNKLQALTNIDWRKAQGTKVNPLWDNVCITAGSVVSNRQARVATLELLKQRAGVNHAGSAHA